MDTTEDFLVALNAIEIDPNMTKDQLKQVIETQIRDLIERYRTERPREVNSNCRYLKD